MISPFDFDPHHPLLSYVIREVRGGRTPQGLTRYTRQIVWVVAALMVAGLVLLLLTYQPLFQPSYADPNWPLQIAILYTVGAIAISIFLFPIVDFVTLFYAAHSFRAEIHSGVKFDLLRASAVPVSDYVAARLTLAQVRAWRVFVFMWWARLLVCGLAAFVFVWALVTAYMSNAPLDWGEVFSWNAFFFVSYFTVAVIIFLILFLLEPLWRFRMMTVLAASLAARLRSGFWMWLALGGAVLLVVALQGALAWGASALGFWSGSEVNYWFSSQQYTDEFRTYLSMTVGIVPFILLPPIVYACQMWLTRWRGRALERFVFAHHGEDA